MQSQQPYKLMAMAYHLILGRPNKGSQAASDPPTSLILPAQHLAHVVGFYCYYFTTIHFGNMFLH